MEYQQEAFLSTECYNTIPSSIDRDLFISLDFRSSMQAAQVHDQTYAIPTAVSVAKAGLSQVRFSNF